MQHPLGHLQVIPSWVDHNSTWNNWGLGLSLSCFLGPSPMWILTQPMVWCEEHLWKINFHLYWCSKNPRRRWSWVIWQKTQPMQLLHRFFHFRWLRNVFRFKITASCCGTKRLSHVCWVNHFPGLNRKSCHLQKQQNLESSDIQMKRAHKHVWSLTQFNTAKNK